MTYYNRIKIYSVYRLPGKTGYELGDTLDVRVVWDKAYYLATLMDPTISLEYGTGKTAKRAIKDLLDKMVDTFAHDETLLEQGKLGEQLSNEHLLQRLFFVKRKG